MSLIQRQVFDWGVQLTARPFEGSPSLGGMAIYSEIDLPRPNRGSTVKITFTAALISEPLRLLDAQAWQRALDAIIQETRNVILEMKTAQRVEVEGSAKKVKSEGAAKKTKNKPSSRKK
jgi:hypothetical protein